MSKPKPVQTPPPRDEPLEVIEKRIADREQRYIEESNLKNESIKRDLAHNAACLFEVLHRLSMEKMLGIGRAEEMRTITSVAGAFRRCVMDLGMTEARTEEELGEL